MTFYRSTGEAYCKRVEQVEGKNFEYQASQYIDQVVDVTDPELVKERSIYIWLADHGWNDGHWIDGPVITELPADQVMALAGAERLPGL